MVYIQSATPSFQLISLKKDPGLVERVSARVGRKIPPLRIENLRPSALFKNKKTVLGVNEISPGLSPSVMLQSPSQVTMFLYVSDCLIMHDLLSYDRYLNIKVLRNNYVCFHIFFIIHILSDPIYVFLFA